MCFLILYCSPSLGLQITSFFSGQGCCIRYFVCCSWQTISFSVAAEGLEVFFQVTLHWSLFYILNFILNFLIFFLAISFWLSLQHLLSIICSGNPLITWLFLEQNSASSFSFWGIVILDMDSKTSINRASIYHVPSFIGPSPFPDIS